MKNQNDDFIKVIAVVLIWAVMVFPAQAAVAEENPADEFFGVSDVSFYHRDGQFILELNTPEAVLCAVNFGPVTGELSNLTAMEMSAPGETHSLELDWEEGNEYRVILTAITKDQEIFRSQEYIVTANPDDLSVTRKGQAEVKEATDKEGFFPQAPVVESVSTRSAEIELITEVPALTYTLWGPTEEFGQLVRPGVSHPDENQEFTIHGLDPDERYFLKTIAIDEQGKLFQTERINFTTEARPEEEDRGENWAALEVGAEVSDVSSMFGGPEGSFAAQNALDGDPASEWSSQGEGDQAWIEVKLPQEIEVTGIGFWTRTMGDTGQIFKVRVINAEGMQLGEFEIPDADDLYNFQISTPAVSQQLRFEVVDSSGGNTGARQIKVYGQPEE